MEALNRLPWAAKNSLFERLSQIADISALSKEERLKYDEGIRKYRDTLCVMEGQYAKGMEKGILMTAKKMKEGGLGIYDIMKFTGLSEDVIRQL